jgi:phosphoglycerate dehydrogenase-like enzyme
MTILLLNFTDDTFTAAQLRQIQAAAGGLRLLQTTDRAEIGRHLDQIEVAVGGLPLDLLPRLPALRWLQYWYAGTDWLLKHPEIRQLDFILTNVSGLHAVPISEHIFAMLLALGRNLPQSIQAQTRHTWLRQGTDRTTTLFELADKTMVLIGVGSIGTRVAKIAAALDMNVIGVRRDPTQSVPGVARMVGPDHLLDVLPEGDFVVLTIPLTEETRGLIDRLALNAMKSSAYLVNIGRGQTIVQADLLRALQDGTIAGAGLDVTEPEPLPADSPLWEMENVIITAHYAGLTPHYTERALAIFLDNLTRYGEGRPLRNVVDKERGY